MCNNEEDFCGVAKYKYKYTNMDKIILGIIISTMSICLVYAAIALYLLIQSIA